MPATVQLNTRIDPDLKRMGDAVFSAAGLTSSEVVRAVWTAAATTQRVPECVLQQKGSGQDARLHAISQGAGVALREAALLGIVPPSRQIDFASLHDEMYESMTEAVRGQYA